MYDSAVDTIKHIKRVEKLLDDIAYRLVERGVDHDTSKLNSPEKEGFDVMTPKLSGCTYGSPEYQEFLKELRLVLDHHYKNNRHHPEHYSDGFAGMTLIDLIECFADWKAASERHADGNIMRSIEVNAKRFNMDPQLVLILKNTAKFLYE